jgi:hypothetical protein
MLKAKAAINAGANFLIVFIRVSICVVLSRLII